MIHHAYECTSTKCSLRRWCEQSNRRCLPSELLASSKLGGWKLNCALIDCPVASFAMLAAGALRWIGNCGFAPCPLQYSCHQNSRLQLQAFTSATGRAPKLATQLCCALFCSEQLNWCISESWQASANDTCNWPSPPLRTSTHPVDRLPGLQFRIPTSTSSTSCLHFG